MFVFSCVLMFVCCVVLFVFCFGLSLVVGCVVVALCSVFDVGVLCWGVVRLFASWFFASFFLILFNV